MELELGPGGAKFEEPTPETQKEGQAAATDLDREWAAAVRKVGERRYAWENQLRQLPTLTLRGSALATAVVRKQDDTSLARSAGLSVYPNASATLLPWSVREPLTAAVVASSRTRERCWVVVSGKVYDATGFLDEHPGGANILLQNAGTDATREFDLRHGAAARNQLSIFYVGELAEPLHNSIADATEDKTFHAARILQTEQITPDAKRIVLELPHALGDAEVLCGGHFLLKPPGATIFRSYTPVDSCSPSGTVAGAKRRMLCFVIKRYPAGEVSPALHNAPLGAEVLIAGPIPCGFTFVPEHHRALLLVGGGTGAAPLLSLAKAAASAKCCASVLISDRTAEDAILVKEFEQLVHDYPGLVSVRRLFSQQSPPAGCRLDAGILAKEPLLAKRGVAAPGVAAVVCGPPSFNSDIGAALQRLGCHTTVLG